MKLNKYLYNRKGFTLVESIVTLVILLIFISSLIAALVPTLNIFNRTINLADDQSVALNIADTIAHKIAYGKYTTISTDNKVLTVDGVQISAPDGYLLIGGADGFDPGYYNGCTVNLSFLPNDSAVNITVEIVRNNKTVFTHQTTIKPLYSGFI